MSYNGRNIRLLYVYDDAVDTAVLKLRIHHYRCKKREIEIQTNCPDCDDVNKIHACHCKP